MGVAEKQEPRPLMYLNNEELTALVREAVRAELIAARTSQDQERLPLLTPAQAAEFLGITADALRKHVGRKHIEPDHRGNRGNGLRGARYSYETLNAFKDRDKRRASDGKK